MLENILLYFDIRIPQLSLRLWFRNESIYTLSKVRRIQWMRWQRVKRSCLDSPAAFYKLAGFTFIKASYLNYFWEVSLDFSEIFKCIWEIKQQNRATEIAHQTIISYLLNVLCSQRHLGQTLYIAKINSAIYKYKSIYSKWSSQRRQIIIQKWGTMALTGGASFWFSHKRKVAAMNKKTPKVTKRKQAVAKYPPGYWKTNSPEI